jgi:hypothetical protein
MVNPTSQCQRSSLGKITSSGNKHQLMQNVKMLLLLLLLGDPLRVAELWVVPYCT